MSKIFWNELWTKAVELMAFPAFIFSGSAPALNRVELSVYSVACRIANQSKNNCRFSISLRDLQTATGYKKPKAMREALRGLVAKGFIRTYGTRKWKEPQAYELCHPETAEGLASSSTNFKHWVKLRTALHRNKIGYFYFPLATYEKLPIMRGSTCALLVAVARMANLNGRNFQLQAAELRDLAGLDQKTFKTEVEETKENWVEFGFTDGSRKIVEVFILDPATGKSLDVLDAEIEAQENAERAERFRQNRAKNGRHSPVNLLAWFLWAAQLDLHHAAGGELRGTCPISHNLRTMKPAFHVNFFKGTHGVFRCFECRYSGKVLDLIVERVGLTAALLKLEMVHIEQPAEMAKAAETLNGYGPDGRYKAA